VPGADGLVAHLARATARRRLVARIVLVVKRIRRRNSHTTARSAMPNVSGAIEHTLSSRIDHV
jgi:hypothetical protein